MAQTLFWLFEEQSHHEALMLARVHTSVAVLNLDFELLEYEPVQLQPKQLSYPYLAHPEQQLVNLGVQQQPAGQHPKRQGQPEVPVVQG
jgi:hypothetical protein